jgi:hypothetical protein
VGQISPRDLKESQSMKRTAKIKTRLTLNRETLRNLEAADLEAAPGGASDPVCVITQSCFQTYCVCITQRTCPSRCINTCPVTGPVISLY